MTSLFEKLLAVRKSVTVVKKDATNQHQRFDYVSSAGVLMAIRTAMDHEGVLLVPSIVNREIDSVATKDGAHRFVIHLDMKYTWYNCEDPKDKLDVPAYTFGVDTDSKAVGKALTYSEKYFLMRFFNIPSDNMDPDADKGHEGYQTKPQQKQWDGDRSKLKGEATDKQKKMIWAIASKVWPDAGNGLKKDKLTEIAEKAPAPFDGSSSDGWTKANASWLIEYLHGLQRDSDAMGY